MLGTGLQSTDGTLSNYLHQRHFPLNVQTNDKITRITQQREATIQHVEIMFQLWFRQKELLQLLIMEQRTRHREMANQNKKKRTFKQGDLLSVRKQETSKEAAEGKPAKLTLKGRGTYMLLEEASNNSYHVQKHLAMQSFMTRFPYSVTRFPYVDTWTRVHMSSSTVLGIGARVTNFTTDIISWPFGV